MKLKNIIFCFIIMTSYHVSAQCDFRFNLGADVGLKSKTGQGGFMIGLDWKNRINIYSGVLNFALFQGVGFSAGSEFFLTKGKWQPTVGATYCYFGSNRFYTEKNDGTTTDYYINFANGLVFHLGIRYLLFPEKTESQKGALSFQPYLSYRNWFHSVKAEYISGTIDLNKQKQINRVIGNGLGIGITITYLFGRNG